MDEESDESAESSGAEGEYEKLHGYELAPVEEYVENARGYEEFRKRQKLSKILALRTWYFRTEVMLSEPTF